jgi:hypothetical protein
MNKPNLAKFFKTVQFVLKKHSPEILTGIGIAGMVGTTVLAVKATPKALKLIEEEKSKHWVDKLPPLETVKVAWKCYIPTAVSGIGSAACLIGAHTVHARRTAALATAYTLSETAFKEYKDKVIEVIGDKKERTVREKVAQDRIEKRQINPAEIIVTDKGETLFLDPVSDRLFKSDIESVRKAANKINYIMTHDPFDGAASLSDFYDELGLNRTSISDKLGWSYHNGAGLLEIDLHPAEKDGKPCFMLDYNYTPQYEFSQYCP